MAEVKRKKYMKKYLILGLMFLVLSFGAVAVFAENNSTNTTTSASAVTAPMMINIGPNGNVMLRGAIVSVGTDSLVVKSWGGSWTVKVSADTKVISINKLLSDFKADDIVGVLGSISEDGNFVIDARILRAWGPRLDSDKDGIPDNQDDDIDNNGKHDSIDRHEGRMPKLMMFQNMMDNRRGPDNSRGSSNSGSGEGN